MTRLLMLLVLLAGNAAHAAGEGCLQPEEARTLVREQRLIDMPEAAGLARNKAKGDVVSANLCRVNQRLVYVVAVLSKDGRVTRMAVDAQTRVVSDHR